jgi:iron complex outermembrane receptor protein
MNGGKTDFADGTSNWFDRETLLIDWRPAKGVEIVPFWSLFNDYDDESSIFYSPAGDFLPPQPRSDHFSGPWWENLRSTQTNQGLLSSISFSPTWTLRTGLFRSLLDWHSEFNYLMTDVQPDGVGHRTILADPPQRNVGLSGELRLSHTLADGPRLHIFQFSLRGRDTRREFGGSDVIDLGESAIDADVHVPRPQFDFGPISRDHVRQLIYGGAYDVRWKAVGELGFGISGTDYRKSTITPGLTVNHVRRHYSTTGP